MALEEVLKIVKGKFNALYFFDSTDMHNSYSFSCLKFLIVLNFVIEKIKKTNLQLWKVFNILCMEVSVFVLTLSVCPLYWSPLLPFKITSTFSYRL